MPVIERCDYCSRPRGDGHSRRCSHGQFGERYSIHRRDLEAEVERLCDWLHYIEQTTSDPNVLAAIELANKGGSAEFDNL